MIVRFRQARQLEDILAMLNPLRSMGSGSLARTTAGSGRVEKAMFIVKGAGNTVGGGAQGCDVITSHIQYNLVQPTKT